MTVLAATRWDTNADMIVDCVALGYVKPADRVIDLTFGGGKWWTKYHHPGQFWANFDPDADIDAIPAYVNNWICRDFRDLRHVDDLPPFDVTVFDPPYVSMGGRTTSGMPEFMDRYGLANAATTPERLQIDNERGLAEAAKITRPGGLVLAKCAPYISSGVRKEGDWWARDAAVAMGLRVEDMLIHLGDERAQPKYATCRKCGGDGVIPESDGDYEGAGVHEVECPRCKGKPPTERKQRHARNNYSVLWVFKKPTLNRRKKAT